MNIKDYRIISEKNGNAHVYGIFEKYKWFPQGTENEKIVDPN